MGSAALTIKQFIITLYLCLSFHNIECSNIKFDNTDLEGNHLYVINDVGMSSEYEFGTLKTQDVCNDTNQCSHGARCYNNTCLCLPGTSGPLCETINGCSDLSCDKDKNATCVFDTKNFKAFCKCPFGQEFDYDENKCKDCLCEDDPYCLEYHECHYQMKCEFIRGEKTCTCSMPSYKLNPKQNICQFCSCGDNAEECYYDDDGKHRCKCKENYAEQFTGCERCTCSNADGCKFDRWNKICICKAGYVQFNNDCYKCTCGKNGICLWGGSYSWNIEQKGCKCDPGYTEINGVCTEISECYCGENSNCTLLNGEKNCTCQEGFTDISGICTDINECDNPEACPENTKCFNLIGSYECSCADGYQPSKDKEGECEDIDECQNGKPCSDANTQCFNTVGSFRCVCNTGFAARNGMATSPICEDKSSWKTGFGVLIGIFLAIIIGLVIMIYRKKS